MPCQPLPPFRRPRTVPGRRRPKVLVLDTGLSTLRSGAGPAHPYLADAVVIQPDWRDRLRPMATDDEDEPDADHDLRLDLQSGHGTFIVGIIRRLCPEAEIYVNGVLSGLATSDDATIGHGIERAASRIGRHGPDVVVMSLGAYTDDDQPPPLAGWIERFLGNSVVVAAAGNSASPRPVFPAALPGVVAVGALDSTRPRPVLQLRRLGRRMRAGGRRGQHVLHALRRHGERRESTLPRVGAMERHQLRGAEGRGGHRPRHVPQRWHRPRRVDPPLGRGTFQVPRPRRRLQPRLI